MQMCPWVFNSLKTCFNYISLSVLEPKNANLLYISNLASKGCVAVGGPHELPGIRSFNGPVALKDWFRQSSLTSEKLDKNLNYS